MPTDEPAGPPAGMRADLIPDAALAVSPAAMLRARVTAAVREVLCEPGLPGSPGLAGFDGDVALHRSSHADFQADVALALGRTLKRPPRELAVAIAARLRPGDGLAEATVSGPGFINLTLSAEYLAASLDRMLHDVRLGVPQLAVPETVVVDYSSPNLAKEMHVGHLRSTIIGDAIARVLAWRGDRVVRRNHIGDWGTPFGMLIENLVDENAVGGEASLRELVGFYQRARAKFDGDPAFAERSRLRVVKLQGGDPETLALWRRLVDVSLDHMFELYRRLGVGLQLADVVGESHYNAELAEVVAELEAKGVSRVSQGAICVFPAGFTGRDGEPVPLIVRKQDGGYGYACTDLAALRQRLRSLHARRLIYVVGTPQSQHFAMVFAVAAMAGWVEPGVRLEHVAFGSVLGTDKKMLKTRAGDTVQLAALLDEAIERARAAVVAKSPDLDPAEQARIADAVGVGAIKYADLASDRLKDYVFDWNRMLSFEGNTGPYLMYAHARIGSILRKAAASGPAPGDGDGDGDGAGGDHAGAPLTAFTPEERALALELIELSTVLDRVADTLQPHRLCGYLYDVATAFTRFYEACPVLKAPPAERRARLALCRVTARVLAQGLELLGIAAPAQM
jgi:arginyl-tRNA synthetase